MPASPQITPPSDGAKITFANGRMSVPDNPIIPFFEGDVTGPEPWATATHVLNTAVQKAYGGKRGLRWLPLVAASRYGKGDFGGQLGETLVALKEYRVALFGPVSTRGEGDVAVIDRAVRQSLDLYAQLRPIHWFPGLPSPIRYPQKLNMTLFRENSEDIYSGIEFDEGSEGAKKFLALLQENFPKEYRKIRFPGTAAIGVKAVSREGSERLIRGAISYALANKRKSVTLVHKGNIMKYTEGAFRNWGYELAEREFRDQVYTWTQWDLTKAEKGEAAANAEQKAALASGRLLIKDVIADIALQQFLTRPDEFDIIATLNMNGDYESDALATEASETALAPSGSINFESGVAIFAPAHGDSDGDAGNEYANPGSLLLSGEMMLRHLGWTEAAELVLKGMSGAIESKMLTPDLATAVEGAKAVSTGHFGDAVVRYM